MLATVAPPALSGLSTEHARLFIEQSWGTDAPVAEDRIHAAFERWARSRPHAPAVSNGTDTLTYAELDQRAELLAGRLSELGVRPGDRVGLFLHRGVPMVVGILAVLKTHAAYVPQDPRITPRAHLADIVDRLEIDVVLTLADYDVELTGLARRLLSLDRMHLTGTARRPWVRPVDAPGTAVVIHTSGTTGRPNGVAVTHRNLCNVLLAGPGTLGIRPGMRVAQLLNVAFDMALWEMFGALGHGATLVIRGSDIEATVRTVDVVIATPGVLSRLDPARCRNVAIVAVAGERCPLPLAEAWAQFAAFHNACGPTEVTIVNTVHRFVPGSGRLTIGGPIPNTTVYVLDEHLQPVPPGEVGVMWVGGAAVTEGYVGNGELTEQRYRPDPFVGGEARMFCTRDLGRWTPDGKLEHHGRTDDQVKLRGFRIELDAVTSALERTPGCTRATTLVHNDQLVGVVSPATVDPRAALASVADTLPYYCVPAMIVPVDRLPATSRGKVDRDALSRTLRRLSDGRGEVA